MKNVFKALLILIFVITFTTLLGCSKNDEFKKCEYLRLENGNYYTEEKTAICEYQSTEDNNVYMYVTMVESLELGTKPEGWQQLRYNILVIEAPYINLKTNKYEIRHDIYGMGTLMTPGEYEGKNKHWKRDVKNTIKENSNFRNYGVSGKLGNEYEYKIYS